MLKKIEVDETETMYMGARLPVEHIKLLKIYGNGIFAAGLRSVIEQSIPHLKKVIEEHDKKVKKKK